MVRSSATKALEKIEDETVIKGLIEELEKIEDETVIKGLIEELEKIEDETVIKGLTEILANSYSEVRRFIEKVRSSETFEPTKIQVVQNKNRNIDIYENDIFILTRKLAIRYSRRNLSYIPVYPNPIKRFIKDLFQN